MKRILKRTLGGILLSIPLLFVFAGMLATGGLAAVAVFILGLAILLGCLWGGLALLEI